MNDEWIFIYHLLIAPIETVTPQQAVDEALERGV